MVPGDFGRIVRFGAYEFDPGTGELRKYGLRIRLNGQPVKILTTLIEHPGEIVTRADLQNRLWLAQTHVDFEHSLNAAIKRLRGALGDSPDAPRFIETIARKGYRFIAPLDYSVSTGLKVTRPVEDKLPSPVLLIAPGNEGGRGWSRFFLVGFAAILLALGAGLWFQTTEYFWRSPLAGARFQTITDFDGVEQAAAVSRDGHFVAFLSDRDGQVDIWVTQVGSGEFHNLTQGRAADIVNPSLRTLAFSPDGSLVTYWTRRRDSSNGRGISVWGVPTLGGQPRIYMEGVAEFDWSRDGSRLAYHTPGPGDPLFVSGGNVRPAGRAIFTAAAGLHSHFQLWAPDMAFIYFVQGSLPDKLDVWRIAPSGGRAERITSHVAVVSHPVLLDSRTLMYIAGEPDGSGPWLYSMNMERRIAHRLTYGDERYTSLAASADGRRLVVTRASQKRSLWRLHIGDSKATRIALTTDMGFSPRLGPDYLLYLSITDKSESVWKLAHGVAQELWSGEGAHVFGSPAIAPDGKHIAFSAAQRGRKALFLMAADGTNARILSDSLDLQGAPAWAHDEQSVTSAADDHGFPHLFRIPVDGRPPTVFVRDYSIDPAWAPDGHFAVYSGPDVGTTFPVKAVSALAAARPLPALTLTRGARHLTFLPGGRELIFLRGEIRHKDVWVVNLETGVERQLTNLGPDFEIHDFDVSPDGREVVLERVQERSDVVLLDLARP